MGQGLRPVPLFLITRAGATPASDSSDVPGAEICCSPSPLPPFSLLHCQQTLQHSPPCFPAECTEAQTGSCRLVLHAGDGTPAWGTALSPWQHQGHLEVPPSFLCGFIPTALGSPGIPEGPTHGRTGEGLNPGELEDVLVKRSGFSTLNKAGLSAKSSRNIQILVLSGQAASHLAELAHKKNPALPSVWWV